MTESGLSSSRLGPSPTHVHHDRGPKRRRYLPCCLICLAVILLLALTAVILAVTVFRPRDPQTTLVSAAVSGISPRLSLPPVRIDINVTLELVLLVRNPNYASFAFSEPGKSQLYYRGAQVGEADVAPGRIPPRGSAHVRATVTVEADRLSERLMSLAGDVMAGRVGFDTRTRIPGRVTFLGFIKRHAVATSECHVEIGFPELKVLSEVCDQRTKL